MSTLLERLDSNKVFEGQLIKYKFKVSKSGQKRYHRIQSSSIQSTALGGLDALFNLFLPFNTTQGKVPVLIYLSGLTCTEDNGYVKCSRSDLELLFF
jgi:S-formylglutathione hydrolase